MTQDCLFDIGGLVKFGAVVSKSHIMLFFNDNPKLLSKSIAECLGNAYMLLLLCKHDHLINSVMLRNCYFDIITQSGPTAGPRANFGTRSNFLGPQWVTVICTFKSQNIYLSLFCSFRLRLRFCFLNLILKSPHRFASSLMWCFLHRIATDYFSVCCNCRSRRASSRQ